MPLDRPRRLPRAHPAAKVQSTRSIPSAEAPLTDERPPSAAGAARHATDDPNTFVIPTEALPPGFADTVDDADLIPAPARPAATVVLMRDAAGGPEVLLLRRHGRSGFA